MKQQSRAERQVLHNRDVHDSVVSSYEDIHTEIFNPTEQTRTAGIFEEAILMLRTESEIPLILDFGAGTGNLTKHLLKLGARVLAADVSPKSLASLKVAFDGTGKFDTTGLNGVDLSNLKDNSVDMVATYSVLHHVPDYLGIVREFVRVVKSGGVIYIDHESAPCAWLEDSDDFKAYRKELQSVYGQPFMGRLVRKLWLIFSYNAWRRLVNRKLRGLNGEGDIHVFPDDHIEWDLIEKILLENCELIKCMDYLVCRELEPVPPLYEKHKGKCTDMRFAGLEGDRLRGGMAYLTSCLEISCYE